MLSKIFILSTLVVQACVAFAPVPRSVAASRANAGANTELQMIGGLMQGFFGKKDAPITDTVYFDIEIDGEPAGRIEMGLYGKHCVWKMVLWLASYRSQCGLQHTALVPTQ